MSALKDYTIVETQNIASLQYYGKGLNSFYC
jgi:hypothetical protein